MASSTEQIILRITGYDNTGRAWQSATRRVRSHQKQMQGYTRVVRNAKLQIVQMNASLGAIPAAGLAGITAGFAAFAKSIFTANRKMDAFMNSMIVSTGSIGKAKKEIEKIKTLSDRLGINFIATADAYKKFSIAAKEVNMDLQTSDKVFTSVATASAAMGVSAENTRLTLKALEQMISKGTVQSEELRGQLGEHLPGAFGMAAKAMGVTTAQMGKMLEQGQILAVDLLPKLATVLQDKFQSVAERAARQAGASFERMRNEWNYMLIAFGNTGVFNQMASAIKVVTGWLIQFREGLDTKWVQDFMLFAKKVGMSIGLIFKIAGVALAKMRVIAVDTLVSLTKAYTEFMNDTYNAHLKVSNNLTELQKVVHQAFQDAKDDAKDYAQQLRDLDVATEDVLESTQRLNDMEWEQDNVPTPPTSMDDMFKFKMPSFKGVSDELMILNKDLYDTDKNLAKMADNFSTTLGRGMASALSSSKMSFKDFAKSIIIDITAMILKAAILRLILASLGLAKSVAGSFNMPNINLGAVTTPLPQDSLPEPVALPVNNENTRYLNASVDADRGWNLHMKARQAAEIANNSSINGGYKIEERAKGGSVSSRTPYIVGERGAELFVPRTSGAIVPNNKLGGEQKDTGDLNVTFQINAVDTQSGTAFLMKNQKHIVGMIDQAYRKQGRTGVTA